MRTVSCFPILNPMQHLFGRIDGSENIEILYGDHFFFQQRIPNPVEQALPISLSNEDYRKRFYLSPLDQRDRFKQFVERAEPARQDHEGDRVLHEHYFSYEEIAKVEQLIRVNVRLLFERQFDVESD